MAGMQFAATPPTAHRFSNLRHELQQFALPSQLPYGNSPSALRLLYPASPCILLARSFSPAPPWSEAHPPALLGTPQNRVQILPLISHLLCRIQHLRWPLVAQQDPQGEPRGARSCNGKGPKRPAPEKRRRGQDFQVPQGGERATFASAESFVSTLSGGTRLPGLDYG
jgi:hypothetical protein